MDQILRDGWVAHGVVSGWNDDLVGVERIALNAAWRKLDLVMLKSALQQKTLLV